MTVSTRTLLLCIASLGVLLPLRSANAEDEISAALAESFVYDDGTVEVRIEIGRVTGDLVDATLVVPEGFVVEGPFGGARRTTVINGVSRSVVEIGFRVRPPAGAKGEFKIGPALLKKRRGEAVRIPVGMLEVGRRPEHGVRLKVIAEPPEGPVMMPFLARYRVLYSGRVNESEDVFGSARNPLGLTSLSIPLLDSGDVKVEPGTVPDKDAAGNIRLGDTALRVHRGFKEVDGAIYRTLEFALKITPLGTGDLDLSAEVGMSLVTGVKKRRDFFDRVVEVPTARQFTARSGPVVYRVKDLPADGRPTGFTGAVGRFTIEADLKQIDVNAFDPIEARITIRGQGALERISLPRWSAMPEIMRDFDMDTDLDPGEIEGDAKVFKVVFRARSSHIDRFPALPFPFYDPWSGGYEVALSEPVPIKVREVKTVRPEDAVGAVAPGSPGMPGNREPIGRRLGIGANFESLDGSSGRLEVAPPLFTPGFLALLVIPPLLAALCFLVGRARSRPKDVPRGTPLSRALAALSLEGEAPSPDRAAKIFAAFFRERADLPEGEITTSEIERALQARSLPPEVVERVAQAHRGLISARFAGGEVGGDVGSVLREADRCLD